MKMFLCGFWYLTGKYLGGAAFIITKKENYRNEELRKEDMEDVSVDQ